MVRLMVLLLPWVAFDASALAPCAEPPRPNRANRYEDFFARRREAEARAERLDRAAAEVRGRGVDRAEKLEAARLEYVRTRRAKPDDEKSEAAWREQIQARAKRLEEARECFASAPRPGARGREIPDSVEYGLDE